MSDREEFEAWASWHVGQPDLGGYHTDGGAWFYRHNIVRLCWEAWQAALAAKQKANDGIHTCSYYCTRPECIKAQRDELRDKIEAQQKAEPHTALDESIAAQSSEFKEWKRERDEWQRKKGAYWLTPEGREEIKACFTTNEGSAVRTVLDALEEAEAALASRPQQKAAPVAWIEAVSKLMQFHEEGDDGQQLPRNYWSKPYRDAVEAVEAAIEAAHAEKKQEPVGKVVASVRSDNDPAMIQWTGEYRPTIGDLIYAAPPVDPDGVRLLREAREYTDTYAGTGKIGRRLISAIDAYLARLTQRSPAAAGSPVHRRVRRGG